MKSANLDANSSCSNNVFAIFRLKNQCFFFVDFRDIKDFIFCIGPVQDFSQNDAVSDRNILDMSLRFLRVFNFPIRFGSDPQSQSSQRALCERALGRRAALCRAPLLPCLCALTHGASFLFLYTFRKISSTLSLCRRSTPYVSARSVVATRSTARRSSLACARSHTARCSSNRKHCAKFLL